MQQTEPYLGAGASPASSQNLTTAGSILVADCGTTFTKVSLLGLVEGQYRLMARGVAPTTANANDDITRGIIQALQEIEYITGRHFVQDGEFVSPEDVKGDGADLFVATLSAGEPMRIAVLGAITPELDALTGKAVQGLHAETYIIPAPSYLAATTPAMPSASMPQGAFPQQMGGSWTEQRLKAEWERQLGQLLRLRPHAALIVGVADGPAGHLPLQEACQLVLQYTQEINRREAGGSYQMPVLYAGAPQFVEAVRRILNGHAELTRVDPLTSAAQLGSTSMAANTLYERDVIQRLPGYGRMRSWSQAPSISVASSLSSLVRFLAQHYAMNVTAIDVGSSATTLMMAGEHNEFTPLVNPGVGVGRGLANILQQVGHQRVTRWLTFTMNEDELRQFVLSYSEHPQIIPATYRDLSIIQAFAREAIMLTQQAAMQDSAGPFDADLILATGGVLSLVPHYGQAALMLLDALQPRGVTSLVLDRTMLITQLGAVATVAPIAAVQVNENDAVMHRLGTCVVPFGNLPQGQTAIRVGVEYSNGRQVTVEVMTGSIEIIPLKLSEQALLTLYPSPGVDVGLGPGERARAAEEIDGGLVGLVIDARGRPLALPINDAERQARLSQWMQVVGG